MAPSDVADPPPPLAGEVELLAPLYDVPYCCPPPVAEAWLDELPLMAALLAVGSAMN